MFAPAPDYDLMPFDELPALTADSIEGNIGNTPLLNLSQFAHARGVSPRVSVFGKAEWFNPSGSVKARPALNIIRYAEYTGQLQPGMTLMDSTSGNMGIAYALICAARGYNVKFALPANASPERIKILNAYGADLVLTDPTEGSDGAIREAKRLDAADPDLFYANQYANTANWQAHYFTTAPEIWEQTNGRITHFVAGLGTSGTFMGNTRRFRQLNPAIQCISLQPDSAFHGLEGWKHMSTAIVPPIYDDSLADEDRPTRTEAAYRIARALASETGLFVSPSSAGALTSAIEVARELDEGVVVTILPDNAMKYLSERFWSA